LGGTKLEDLEDVLVIWLGQVKNGTATDKVIKEQARVSTWSAEEGDKFCTHKLVCI
jgi:hypothetical protein